MLEKYIQKSLKTKDILLMTHIVVGYPSLDASMKIVEEMVKAGVDLMELQIPFSEPMADGPVILKANQKSLESGTTVKDCFEFAQKVSSRFDIPFLFMTYYNILYKYGVQSFVEDMVKVGIKGAIIPDLPPEEGIEYEEAMKSNNLCPIYIFSPTTTDERMRYISSCGKGFIYCMARKGVTGKTTQFSNELDEYFGRCRKNTSLPLAVGFGVKEKADIDYLKGKADIAVIGSQTIRLVDEKGVEAVGDFIKGL
ncbi:MAG: tryptophan synthase subunit alpha [Desulfamplus sp.]|nr:tryptophan synthase subunit alpha [Desulfamplus sp.]